MKKINTYKLNWELISKGFGLSIEKTIEMFNDGRMLGRVGEFLHENSENGIRQNENSSFDVKEENNTRSEIRTITDKVSFASSKEVGFGREVTKDEVFELPLGKNKSISAKKFFEQYDRNK